MDIHGNFLGERLVGGSLLTVGCGDSLAARVEQSQMLNTESFRQGEDPCEYQSAPYAFVIEADGVDLSGTYQETDHQTTPQDNGGTHSIRTLHSAQGGLTVQVHTLTDPAAEDGQTHGLTRYLEITNHKTTTAVLGHVHIFGGCLFAHGDTADDARPYRIGYMQDGSPRREGDLVWETLPRGDFAIARRHYTERFRYPYALVQNTATGENIALHLGFSGNFSLTFHNFYTRIPGNNNLSCTVDFGGQAPIRVLAPGETVTTPAVHLIYAKGDLDTLVQYTHDHVRTYCAPWEKCMTLEATSMAKTDYPVQKAIELGHHLGADLFFIDAGWYIPKEGNINRWPAYTGDWTRPVDTYQTSLDEYRAPCSNTWISDESGIPDSFRILNGVTMMLPGEWCNRLIYGMGAPHGAYPYFKLNTARFAAPICGYSEVDGVPDDQHDMCDPEFLEQSRQMFAMHRNYIRPLMGKDRRWYHHTPSVTLGKPGERGILEVASRNGRCDMIAAFTLGEVIDPHITLAMRGVCEDKQYQVYSNDTPIGVYPGAQLKAGLTVCLPTAYDSVCLVAVEQTI